MPAAFYRNLWLVHPDAATCDVLRARWSRASPCVTVHAARFAEVLAHDAFVTAGTRCCIMTAGIDAAVVARFGPALVQRVRRDIVGAYLGEHVARRRGRSSSRRATPGARVSCTRPSMRIPGSIAGTDAVYRAPGPPSSRST